MFPKHGCAAIKTAAVLLSIIVSYARMPQHAFDCVYIKRLFTYLTNHMQTGSGFLSATALDCLLCKLPGLPRRTKFGQTGLILFLKEYL